MRIVSKSECEEWSKDQLEVPSNDFRTLYPADATYEIPTDASAKTAIARAIVSLIDSDRPGLLWITEWSIFPSGENMSLFDAYRSFLGETRSLRDAPGHIFDDKDLPQIECLLDLILYFYWDALLIINGKSYALKISHDEFISVYGKDAECLKSFVDVFERLKMISRR
jgi:hypothetical protein